MKQSRTHIRLFHELKSIAGDGQLESATIFDNRTQAEETKRGAGQYFTPRALIRNILDYNDYDRTLGGNVLFTYRVNAGTAFYLGYDDRFKQGDRINAELLPVETLRRTNRALFAKLQVLLRY
jgi:hypothetical protein